MLAAWLGERFFRTFRPAGDDPDALGGAPDGAYDAVLLQRELRVGVTLGALWEDGGPPGGEDFERLLDDDVDDGGYLLWVPPGAALPADEPQRSDFRLLIGGGLAHLAPAQRREVRVPARLQLAKVGAEGQYVSVSGVLSSHWTSISEGVEGAFHLDGRSLHRLPEEQAELEILLSRVRDRAALLNVEELAEVPVHDYWLVSRLPEAEPAGLTVIGAPPGFDAADGTTVRRLLRRHVRRAQEQHEAGASDFSVLLLVATLAHMDEEKATAALRGMDPAAYGALDLIALVADGRVRQVLQPRSLPWED